MIYNDFISGPELHLWRTNKVFEMLMCLICALQSVVQFWFMFYGPDPFRWISLGFFVCLGLLQLIVILVMLVQFTIRGVLNSIPAWFICGLSIFVPGLSIINIMFYTVTQIRNSRSN